MPLAPAQDNDRLAHLVLVIPADAPPTENHEMAIKGTIHEFGHALGLPHIGPRPGVKLGNTLMGPTNRVFCSRTGPDDPRVYLSEASAAALWKHPVSRKESTREVWRGLPRGAGRGGGHGPPPDLVRSVSSQSGACEDDPAASRRKRLDFPWCSVAGGVGANPGGGKESRHGEDQVAQ